MARSLSKGEATREAILDAAIALAREVGLASLTIGALAERVGMSKSGLFAHFGAKEELQLAVLRAAQARFDEQVLRPALTHPRGLKRLRAMYHGWLDWTMRQERPGGCVILAAASEFDDRPGPVRDFLASQTETWLTGLGRMARLAVEAGELPADTDIEQFAFEWLGLILSVHHHHGLLDDQRFYPMAWRGLERLIAAPPRLTAASPG
ncbi:TetR/AcrR family transcriptional regulator [Chitinimonas lacunae]|uniref:TetR/AcrR family transcriptional regulator n=1 Tax=Chitinimonas lacunae TaxID=1963018 RepID=A0ABV8MMU9_9NEIS